MERGMYPVISHVYYVIFNEIYLIIYLQQPETSRSYPKESTFHEIKPLPDISA